MTQMNLSMKQTHSLMVAKDRRGTEEGQTESFGLTDVNYYIQINNKILLYIAENYIQYLSLNNNGKSYEK